MLADKLQQISVFHLTAASQGRTLATSLPYRREDWEKLFSGTSRRLGDGKDLNYFIMCIIHLS